MQHVSELTKTTTSQNSQACQTDALDGNRVKRIFANMQATYGTRWVQQTGTGQALKLSQQVWGERLAGLTDSQIVHGLKRLPEDYPPTPQKFRRLCTENTDALHNTDAYKFFHDPNQKRLPKLKAQEQIVRKEQARIREIMGRTA